MDNIEGWLNRLGLAQYARRFAENFVDTSVLRDLTDEDLVSLGIPLGHRKKILRAIAELDQSGAGAAMLVRHDVPERRQLTVMFCDLVGSTPLSERLDPEDMRDVIGAYQGACARVIPIYEGFVCQYLGDGILVYFGYPRAHEDDAERAVRAALDIIRAIGALATPARDPLAVRIGIATGIVVVGDTIGEGASQQQMAVGPTPNLAARLQTIADPGTVVVADSTRRLLRDGFLLRELPNQTLKGIAEPVKAWLVEGISQAASRFEAARSVRLTDFVGREAEARLLEERLTRAFRGEGQVVVISGEAGIGKSRLTGSLAARLDGQPHTQLRYHCSPYHSGSALYPFVRQIEQAAGISANDPAERMLDKLEALTAVNPNRREDVVPILGALFSATPSERYPPLGLSAAQQRRRTFETLLDQLEALGSLGPVLMLFEDLHWADATSIELIEQVFERIQKLPVFLVITVRSHFPLPWKDGQPNVTTMELARLARSAVEAIVANVTGGCTLPDEVMDQIVAKTDGVPLFVEELTKAVLEAEILVREDNHYRLTGPLPPFAIPATLQDSLMARLDRLGAAKEVAQVGAAIGRQFSYGLLKTVITRDGADLETALVHLEAADLIVSRGDAQDATYRFKHALVQDTAYESLLKSRRQVVHHRIAEAIRDQFPGIADAQPEILAYHYSQAGLANLAIEWWTTASEWARSRSAYAEAVTHLQKALDVAAELPVTSKSRSLRLKVQSRYGRTLLAAKGWASTQVTDAFVRAKALAAQLEDAPQQTALDFCLWYCNYMQGAPQPLGACSAEFLGAIGNAPTDPLQLQLSSLVRFLTSWFEGDFANARDLAEARFRDLNLSGSSAAYAIDLDPNVTVRIYLALIFWPLGEVTRAARYKEEALVRAVRKGDVATLANTLAHCCYFESLGGNFAAAREHGQALAVLSREYRLEGWFATAEFYVGLGRFHAGDTAAGMAQMLEASAGWDQPAVGLWIPFNSIHLAEAQGRLSGADAGLERLQSTLAEIQRSGIGWIEAELYRKRAQLLAARTQSASDLIEADLKLAIEIARRQNARSFELRAATALAQLFQSRAQLDLAREVLAAALTGFTGEVEFREAVAARELLAVLDQTGVQAV